MDRKDNSMYHTHNDVFMLLPWHVNETLDKNERRLVERHLKVCLSCRKELMKLQKLAEGVAQPSTMDTAASASFSRFKEQLQLQAGIEETKKLDIQENAFFIWCKDWLAHSRRPMTMVFTGVFILLLSFTVLFSDGANLLALMAPDFRTLTTANSTESQHHDLRIVFADGLPQSQVNQILDTIHGKIVEGPSSQGAVLVRLANGHNSFDNAIEQISLLRKRTDVIFAEPAFPLSSGKEVER